MHEFRASRNDQSYRCSWQGVQQFLLTQSRHRHHVKMAFGFFDTILRQFPEVFPS